MSLEIEERRLSADADGLNGYLARPSGGGPWPGILLLHGVSGPAKYEPDVRAFAEHGAVSLVADLYALAGSPRESYATEGKEIQTRTSDKTFVEAIVVAWDCLLRQPGVDPKRVGVSAHCMGGRLGLHFAAVTPGLAAFVGYYPTVTEEPATELRPRRGWEVASAMPCPSLMLFGAEDEVVPVHIQERLQAELLRSGHPVEWHVFASGNHGFALEGWTYDARLTRLAEVLTLEFVSRQLGAQPPALP